MQRIKLNVRKIQHACERLGERSLPNAAGANHDYTRHLVHDIELLRHL
jgi:hypothetical protein